MSSNWACRHPESCIAVHFETHHVGSAPETIRLETIRLEAIVWFYCLSCGHRFDILPHRRAVADDKAYLPLAAEVN